MTLPKTAEEISNGGLFIQAVRCGKPNCRCASGDLHKGYYYYIRRVGGRLKKAYVPKRDVEQLWRLIQQSRLARKAERDTAVGSRKLLSELRERSREYNTIITNLIEAVN